MSWTPISGTIPQYQKADGTLASDYYLKFYASGTSTAISMATNASGSTTLAKAQIGTSGYPVNGSGEPFIPHINQVYKIVLFKNATDADNNTTANAEWVIDSIQQSAAAAPTQIVSVEAQLGSDASGQVFTLNDFTYSLGINNLFVYQNGQLLRQGASYDYEETTSSTITVNSSRSISSTDTWLFVKGTSTTSSATNAASVSYEPGTPASTTTVQDKLREAALSVSSYSALRASLLSDEYATNDVVLVYGSGLYGFGTIVSATGSEYVDDGGVTIVANAGTSTAGMLVWVRQVEDVINLDWFDPDGTRANDSIAIRSAISTAAGKIVKLNNKRYYYDGTTIAESIVRIHGSGIPQVNSGQTALENGSIIDGSLTFTSDDVDLRDFGVDVGSASSATEADAIRCSATTINAGGQLHTENIVGLCKSSSSPHHAMLFQSFLKHTGGNLHGIYSLFGFVSKCQNVDLGLIHTIENDESGVLLKSDTGFGRCRDVSIQRVICDCSASQKRGFHIQSSDDGLRDVQVGLVKSDGAEENVLIQVGASGTELRNISIDSILSKNSQSKDLGIDCVNGSASIFNVRIGSLVTEGTQTFGIRVLGNGDTDDLHIGHAFINYEASALQATMDASCFIGTNTTKSVIGDLTILRNFSSAQIGGITYNSNLEDHVLGSRVCNVYGLIENGVSQPSLTGTGNAITIPKNPTGSQTSLVRAAPTGSGVEINQFSIPVSGADNFTRGHKLTIVNNSLFSLTIKHNPGSGVYNANGQDRVMKQNESSSWVLGGSNVWTSLVDDTRYDGILEPATDTELNDISDLINTTNKFAGKAVWNSTQSYPVYALGSGASSTWRKFSDDTLSNTPV